MLPVSTAFSRQYLGNHTIAVKAELLDASSGALVMTLDVSGGAIEYDLFGPTTGTLETLPPDLATVPSTSRDSWFPSGLYEIRLSRGIQLLDGSTELVLLGIFRPTRFRIHRGSDITCEFELRDRSDRISRKLVTPYIVAGDTNFTEAIGGMLQRGWAGEDPTQPSPPLRLSDTTYKSPTLNYDSQADLFAEAMQNAESIGKRLYVARDGYGTLVDTPTMDQAPAMQLIDGVSDTRVSIDREFVGDDVPNVVVVSGTNSGLTQPVTGIYTDPDTEMGPTSGRGTIPKFVPSVHVTTNEQATAQAFVEFQKAVGAGDSLEVEAVPYPPLEVGDVVRVQQDLMKLDRYYMVQGMTLPLGNEAMHLTLGRAA